MNFGDQIALGSVSFAHGIGIRIKPERLVRSDRFLEGQGMHPHGKSAAEWGGTGKFHIHATRIPTSFGGLHCVLAESEVKRPLIVYCGGSGFREETGGGPVLRALVHHGDVMFFNYPGYGKSAGTGRKAEFAETIIAVRAFAEAQAARRGTRLVYWGHSFGGGIAAAIASTGQNILALLLEGTFGSLTDVVRNKVGPFGRFFHAEYTAETVHFELPEMLAKFPHPIIVVASHNDRVIPFAVTRKLAGDLAHRGREVTFVELQRAPHIGLFNDPDHRPQVHAALMAAATGSHSPAG